MCWPPIIIFTDVPLHRQQMFCFVGLWCKIIFLIKNSCFFSFSYFCTRQQNHHTHVLFFFSFFFSADCFGGCAQYISRQSMLPRLVCRSLTQIGVPRIPLGTREFHMSGICLKDKVFSQPSAGPRKSKFATDKDDKKPSTPKIKSEDDVAKQEAAKKEREQKKKENRLKQLDIQKKRASSMKPAKGAKITTQKKSTKYDDSDDDE
jgi:hypothetical protein